MKRAIVLAVASIVIAGCSGEVDDATKRFDAAFWQTWLFHLDEGDRKAVCWQPPEEAAATYGANFDGYLPAQQRAEHLFEIACRGMYP